MRTIINFILILTLYWFIRKVITFFLNFGTAVRGGASSQRRANPVNYVENETIPEKSKFSDVNVIEAEFVELDKDGKEIK